MYSSMRPNDRNNRDDVESVSYNISNLPSGVQHQLDMQDPVSKTVQEDEEPLSKINELEGLDEDDYSIKNKAIQAPKRSAPKAMK